MNPRNLFENYDLKYFSLSNKNDNQLKYLIVQNNYDLFILLSNFSEIAVSVTEMSYNTFFTLLFFPFFWFLFTFYNSKITFGKNA